ncbi:MAG: 3-hydroxybutyrate dehydrogenase [Alphaproteobacteria bacterium]
MSLKGKTAIITGATSGIGYAIAETLASNNCNVVINGFAELHELANIVGYLSSLGDGKAVHCASDLTKLDDIQSLIQFTQDSFGGADILVNNAGMQHVAPIEDFSVENWDKVIALDLSACFHLIRLTLPFMRTKGWGRIVNIASAHGLVASVNKIGYVTAKHGLVGMTKVVGLETAQENITCNAICPGWVLTPLVKKQIEERAKVGNITVEQASAELLAEKQPSGAFVKPEAIGELVLFLTTEAAAQMTGTSLSIDGGWVAR